MLDFNIESVMKKYTDTIALNAEVRKVCWLDAYVETVFVRALMSLVLNQTIATVHYKQLSCDVTRFR